MPPGSQTGNKNKWADTYLPLNFLATVQIKLVVWGEGVDTWVSNNLRNAGNATPLPPPNITNQPPPHTTNLIWTVAKKLERRYMCTCPVGPSYYLNVTISTWQITGKTGVLYSELGEITGKTPVLPCGLLWWVGEVCLQPSTFVQPLWSGAALLCRTPTGPSLRSSAAWDQKSRGSPQTWMAVGRPLPLVTTTLPKHCQLIKNGDFL